MPKSKYDILNMGFGVLNPEYSSLSGKNYNPDDESASFFSQGAKTIQDMVGATKSEDFHGPMVGICLRNDGRVSETGWVDPTCWAALSSDIVEEGSKMDLVQVRVRIPELHASKPIPSDLPDKFSIDSNHDIINQYPVFVSRFAGVSEPSAGDLVWIDFQNRNSQTGGIFLGIADARTSGAKSEGEPVGSASDAFARKGKKTKIGDDGAKIPYDKLKFIWQPLLDFIQKLESGSVEYDAIFANKPVPPETTPGFKDFFKKKISTMTIEQAAEYGTFYKKYYAAQAAKKVPPKSFKSGAIGKYQQIPSALVGRAEKAGLDPEDLFNAENQDKIVIKFNIMSYRKGEVWLEGGRSDGQFMINLSKAFSSFPAYNNKYALNGTNQKSGGKCDNKRVHKTHPNSKWFYYPCQGSTTTTPVDVEKVLHQVKNRFKKYAETEGLYSS